MHLPLRTKLWFGVGQIAEGLKGRVFETFLFFYYEQVLGLSASLSAAALILSVVWDAGCDPLAGSLSDSLRSRWGRRHPLMYASAIPLGVTFFLLFRPPAALGQAGLFVWLAIFSVLARTCLSAYSIPHFALGAELSNDYHERTSVVAFRSWFQQVAAWSVTPLAFSLFFTSTAQYQNGQLDPAAYPGFAAFFAVVMVASILASAAGTHDRIPFLPRPVEGARTSGLRRVFGELRDALRSPSFRSFVFAVLVYAVGVGSQRVLELYMRTYFWRLEPGEIFRVSLFELLGAMVGIPYWARTSRRLGKKWTFIAGILLYAGFASLPPLALLLGWFPSHAQSAYLALLALCGCAAAFGSSGHYAVGGSLMADLVDEHELETGERRAGLLFGVINFASKFTPVAGIWLASLVLAWIGLPHAADPSSVDPESLRRLGWVYGPMVFVLMALSSLLLSRYRISWEHLLEIQAALRARRS